MKRKHKDLKIFLNKVILKINGDLYNLEQVAEFFEVDLKIIKETILELDGFKLEGDTYFRGKDLLEYIYNFIELATPKHYYSLFGRLGKELFKK